MVYTQLLQARVQRSGDISNVRQNFCDDVELFASNAGLLDGSAQLGLGLVHFGAIKVIVAKTDGHFCAVNALLVELTLISSLVPGCTCAVAQLFEEVRTNIGARNLSKAVKLTIGMLVPSFNLRFGMGV